MFQLFHLQHVSMFMFCVNTNFHMFSTHGSLVIAINPKCVYGFHFVSVHVTKKLPYQKLLVFPQVSYPATFQDLKVNGNSISPTSQICVPLFLFLVLGNYKRWQWSISWQLDVYYGFY